jgi:2-iminobutanoate/2-iminopropanoate deaminase
MTPLVIIHHSAWEPSLPQKTIKTDKAPAAIGPYSQGIVANGFLFTAGQIALDPSTAQVIAGDVKAQTERVLNNLSSVLAAAGCSWSKILGDARPARTTVQVAGLPRGVLVEIDAIAELA